MLMFVLCVEDKKYIENGLPEAFFIQLFFFDMFLDFLYFFEKGTF